VDIDVHYERDPARDGGRTDAWAHVSVEATNERALRDYLHDHKDVHCTAVVRLTGTCSPGRVKELEAPRVDFPVKWTTEHGT